MPVENRLDMELTGIKTPVGIKIQGPSLDGDVRIGIETGAMTPWISRMPTHRTMDLFWN
jgi:Cu/Ag efflux pump CusA